MKTFEIALEPMNQRFDIVLNGRHVDMTIRWKETREGGWSLDIDDAETKEHLALGIPLVAGADLLEPFAYLGIPCRMFIVGDGAREATRDNLGKLVKLCIAVEKP